MVLPLLIPLTACLVSRPPAAASDAWIVRTDVPYSAAEGWDPTLTSLDIYAVPGRRDAPVVVFVHGGSWRTGDKANARQQSSMIPWVLDRGCALVAVNHRLIDDPRSPGTGWADQVDDLRAALARIRTDAPSFGGDPDHLVLVGYSSGAHLVALVGMDPPPGLRGVVSLDVSAYDIPRAIAEGCGQGWCAAGPNLRATFGAGLDEQRAASPIHQVSAAAPPFLVVSAPRNGGRTQRLSRAQSDYLVAALTAVGVPARHHHAADETHGSLVSDLGGPGDGVTRALATFLDAMQPAHGQRRTRAAPGHHDRGVVVHPEPVREAP
jgi:arylformamidase